MYACVASDTVRKKLKYDDAVAYESQRSLAQPDQPVYENPPQKYSAENIINILLTAKPEEICQLKPKMITRSATFVVNLCCLENQDDIKKDEFGIWHYSGSHPQVFHVKQEDDGYMSIERCEAAAKRNNVMLLRRLHCTHPSNAEF